MRVSGDISGPFIKWVESVYLGQAAFTDEAFTEWNGEEFRIDWLLGKLWNCSDIVGHAYWSLVEMPPNSKHTVAAMVRHIKAEYRNPN